jgi:hypothetical protein
LRIVHEHGVCRGHRQVVTRGEEEAKLPADSNEHVSFFAKFMSLLSTV